MATIPAFLSDLGFTDAQLDTQYTKRKEQLGKWREQEFTKKQASQIMIHLIEMGSLKSAGGIVGLASDFGCTIEHAQDTYNAFIEYIDAKRAE